MTVSKDLENISQKLIETIKAFQLDEEYAKQIKIENLEYQLDEAQEVKKEAEEVRIRQQYSFEHMNSQLEEQESLIQSYEQQIREAQSEFVDIEQERDDAVAMLSLMERQYLLSEERQEKLSQKYRELHDKYQDALNLILPES